MLTPVEIQGITFKTGRGYKRDDVDSFMKALHHDYEIMYKENQDLKERIVTLSDGIQYYKNLEKTLQKALVLAEKTSEETREAARKQADTIEHNAKVNAEKMLFDARKELDRIEVKTQELLQNFELYKAQYRQILTTQMELVQSSSFDIQKRKVEGLKELQSEETVPSEIKKALDAGRAEEKSADEEAIQEHNLAEQVKLEQELQAAKSKMRQIMKKAEEEAASEEEDNDKRLQVSDEESEQRQIEEELASSVEELVKEQVDSSANDSEENAQDTDTDLEIKMLQKLLNEIKKANDTSTSDEEFEFINADSDE